MTGTTAAEGRRHRLSRSPRRHHDHGLPACDARTAPV